MTTRELRQMLFNVENQKMTVEELRRILFNVVEQDEKLTDTQMMVLTHKR